MHNMIIEDDRDLTAPIEQVIKTPLAEVERMVDEDARFQQFVGRYRQIRDKDAHFALRNAIINHMWEKFSNLEI